MLPITCEVLEEGLESIEKLPFRPASSRVEQACSGRTFSPTHEAHRIGTSPSKLTGGGRGEEATAAACVYTADWVGEGPGHEDSQEHREPRE